MAISNEKPKSLPSSLIVNDNDHRSRVEDIQDAWENHFKAILTSDDQLPPATDSNFSAPNLQIDVNSLTELNAEISLQEVSNAIYQAHRGKACGIDEIPVELLHSIHVRQFLTKLYNSCFQNGVVPNMWNHGILTPIIKNSNIDRRIITNYRGITLIPHICKIYSSIMNYRLTKWVADNKILHDEQNGFRKKRSCQDHLQSFYSIVQTRKLQGYDTFTAFVDFSRAYDNIPRDHLWFKLKKLGLQGNFLNALMSLYKNVSCSVRSNFGLRNDFKVTKGLKQGCLLSPILFNLYLNDLVTELKNLKRGIYINGQYIPVLLYADDLVLIGKTSEDIQEMLKTLDSWCKRWGLFVNENKTKVIHFRKKNKRQTKFNFKCGEKSISICDKYKYLGLWFNEHLELQYTASQVAASAQRSLGLLIANSKCNDFSFDCFTKLYNSLVQPIIDYGASVWGHTHFSCIEAVQNRAMRFFLGVPSKTPNTAVIGEMGWMASRSRIWICIARLFTRYSNMEDDRLNKIIFKWALASKSRNWTKKCFDMFNKYDMEFLTDIDQPKSKQAVINETKSKLMEDFVNTWQEDINRVLAKRGQGHNKLRLYKHFKNGFGTENYVKLLQYKDRCVLAKLRCGVAPIRVETGRYEGLTYEERMCPYCKNVVEDESHLLLVCPLYNDIRKCLFEYLSVCNNGIFCFSKMELLKLILASTDIKVARQSAKTCIEILKCRNQYVCSQPS